MGGGFDFNVRNDDDGMAIGVFNLDPRLYYIVPTKQLGSIVDLNVDLGVNCFVLLEECL